MIILVVLAVGGFVALLAVSDWDFGNLKYENHEHELTEDFSQISVDVNSTDVNVLLSTNNKCSVICFENNNYSHSVSVVDGTLVIKSIHKKVFFGYKDTVVSIYLPEKEYSSIDIITGSGDIDVKNLKAKNINLSVDTGEVELENIVCDVFTSTGDTGDIELKNVVASSVNLERETGEIDASLLSCSADVAISTDTGDISIDLITCSKLSLATDTGEISLDNVVSTTNLIITTDTGDVVFTKIDASNIEITTTTGEVNGSFLSDKIFAIRTSSGKVDVPQTTSGGVCKITTRTGDIIIKIAKN